VTGQNIICAYEDCKKKSAKVNCPHCQKINVFPNGDYCFGKNYKCIYSNCGKDFGNFMCPGCSTCLNLAGKYLEGNRVVCGISGCKINFINFRCPHCMQIILDKGFTYKFGQTVVCPYTTCQKKFNYLYCVSCRKGIYFKDNNYQEGQMIKCPFSECNKTFVFVYCAFCEKPVSFNDVKSGLGANSEIKCCYTGCEQKFKLIKINNAHWTAGVPFLTKFGRSFNFVNPFKEPREMNILLNMIFVESIYKNLGHQIKQIEDKDAQKKEVYENNPVTGIFYLYMKFFQDHFFIQKLIFFRMYFMYVKT
jgi:hypothetical protein